MDFHLSVASYNSDRPQPQTALDYQNDPCPDRMGFVFSDWLIGKRKRIRR